MPHDDSNKCKEDGVKIQQHVMAPTLNYNTNPWMWSKCSRKYITEFLEYVIVFLSSLLQTCILWNVVKSQKNQLHKSDLRIFKEYIYLRAVEIMLS